MRTFYVTITFQNKGTGYDITHSIRTTANQPQTAISEGIRLTRKKYGKRFRVAEGSRFLASVTAGAAVSKEPTGPELSSPEGGTPCASNTV